MIVLNVFGKIEKTCISEKLKLFISNLPKDDFNNWNKGLVEEMKIVYNKHLYECEIKGYKNNINIQDICKRRFPKENINEETEVDYCFQLIADNMICLFFDYNYEDMPLGDWTMNCFDSRLCEVDYAGKILHLFDYLFENKKIYSIYSSDDEESSLRIFTGNLYSEYIELFVEFKTIIDNFITEKNDYLLIEYLCNALFSEPRYDESHLYRLYSLCQFFLENRHETELDEKLPLFLDLEYKIEDKKLMAQLLRQMRNKIAHGDFVALDIKIEEYAQKVLDGRYYYDYSEYSRKNWVLLNACCNLVKVIKKLIFMKFTNRQYIEEIKKR